MRGLENRLKTLGTRLNLTELIKQNPKRNDFYRKSIGRFAGWKIVLTALLVVEWQEEQWDFPINEKQWEIPIAES